MWFYIEVLVREGNECSIMPSQFERSEKQLMFSAILAFDGHIKTMLALQQSQLSTASEGDPSQ